ncbi:DUF1491 family protein [Parvularcula lutaonensis]|uniref:DUF1491 family protein n=1 Tax=Parvularcula lutaonensis TaxID=491923 RepID=A0ABV7MF06_9PROT|nr:DUF1491 family protein [Parvularcula lutaonensis]GGY53114.1 hypothetical protein GCM10007148_22930 [Parvularcula lutaonensis]
MAPRLRSDVQVSALQRAVEAEGLMFAVLHKGHEEGGMIFVKWVEGREAVLFTEQTIDNERRWVRRGESVVPEAEANAIIASEREFDPDLWAVEVMGSFEKAERILNPADQS